MRGYRLKCAEFFEEQLKLASEGKDFKTSFNGSKPQSYISEYDLAISMLKYHTQETIKLDSNDARCFLEDKWDWSYSFVSGSSIYTGSTSGSSGVTGIIGSTGTTVRFNDNEL